MKVDIFNTDKKYQIIYADPPWDFKRWSDKAQRHVTAHYPVMNVEDIKRLPVQDMAADPEEFRKQEPQQEAPSAIPF